MKKITEKRPVKAARFSSVYLMIIGIFLLPGTVLASPVTAERLVELVNTERQKSGLDILERNPLLDQAAKSKTEAILSAQRFEHNIGERRFSDWIKDQNYEYSYVGENLAMDFEDSDEIMAAWLASPTHKRNILNSRFTDIGIGITEGDFQNEKTLVIAQIFGSPLIPIEKSAVAPTDADTAKSPFILLADRIGYWKTGIRRFEFNTYGMNSDAARFLYLIYINISTSIFYSAVSLHIVKERLLSARRQTYNQL